MTNRGQDTGHVRHERTDQWRWILAEQVMAGVSAASGVTHNHSDLSHHSNCSTPLQSSFVRVSVLFLLLPIPIMAVLGNLFIISAVARFRSLQTHSDAFIVSLAVADFLVAVLVMPFSLVRSVDSWHFGRIFCQIHFLLDVSLCTSSIYNLCCVALDRYIAVCDPLHYPTRMSTRRVGTLLVLLCWILPLVLSALYVFLGMYKNTPSVLNSQKDAQICLAAFHIPFAFASSALSFFIPVGFILFAYGKIFMAAQKQMKRIHPTASGKQHSNHNRADSRLQVLRHSLKTQMKALKSLGLIVGLFLVCWLPFFCIHMINPLKGYTLSPLILETTLWLAYANSSLNPFLYAMFNKCYCRAFVSVFGCEALGRPFFSLGFGRQTVCSMDTVSR